ncbi:hypothetical protein NC797_03875 [Aquibacillus sp. 3ASR75-11]|uniref:Uncharacterized protein n=1 Tax=Terrihalobacillus insolitus TaxID=2950438 RepID=A0A9X3WPR0_9BACI|nr:hypothetical protein [Terrihalobacillus insolitus]MDC3423647.1 hypothetical protein [Terrihalobacillus insolitus]
MRSVAFLIGKSYISIHSAKISHPNEAVIFFQSIDEEARMKFFKKQGKRRIETEYWAFDTTSISSYSDTLKQVKQGRIKEGTTFQRKGRVTTTTNLFRVHSVTQEKNMINFTKRLS